MKDEAKLERLGAALQNEHRLEREIASLRAEVESLKDPNVVHVNMLRGGIAKPSIAQIIHIYGEEAIRGALTQTKDTTDDA